MTLEGRPRPMVSGGGSCSSMLSRASSSKAWLGESKATWADAPSGASEGSRGGGSTFQSTKTAEMLKVHQLPDNGNGNLTIFAQDGINK